MEKLTDQTSAITEYIDRLLEIGQQMEEALTSSDRKRAAELLGRSASKLALLSDEIATMSFEISIPQAEHDQQNPDFPAVLPGLNILNLQETKLPEEQDLELAEAIIPVISADEFNTIISHALNPKYGHILKAFLDAMTKGEHEISVGAIRQFVDKQQYDVNVDEAELSRALRYFSKKTGRPLGEIIPSVDDNPQNIVVNIYFGLADSDPQ